MCFSRPLNWECHRRTQTLLALRCVGHIDRSIQSLAQASLEGDLRGVAVAIHLDRRLGPLPLKHSSLDLLRQAHRNPIVGIELRRRELVEMRAAGPAVAEVRVLTSDQQEIGCDAMSSSRQLSEGGSLASGTTRACMPVGRSSERLFVRRPILDKAVGRLIRWLTNILIDLGQLRRVDSVA